MATDRSAIVGAFVVGGLALAVGATLFFGGTKLFEHSVRAVVFFEGSVAGLEEGAPVTFRGVNVGSVQQVSLHLSPDGRATIPVYLTLLPDRVVLEPGLPSPGATDLQRLIAGGLRAQLSLRSFVTAQLRVDLDMRPDTPVRLIRADTGSVPQIPSIQSGLERLQNTLAELPLQDLATAALGMLATVERLAGHVDARLDPLVEEIRGALRDASRMMATMGQSVAQLQSDASHTLQSVDRLAVDGQRHLDQRSAELSAVLVRADRVGRQAEALLVSLNDMTVPRARFREDLEATARDLAASASSLRAFAREIERNPGALLRGRVE